MQFKSEKQNPLTEALIEYQNALERGNYKTLDNYKLEHRDWSDQDELEIVQHSLKFTSIKLNSPDMAPDSLLDDLKSDCPIGLPRIAHLRASLHILENQRIVKPVEEWDQFKTTKVRVWVEDGMPGPCLVYLGSLRCSNLGDRLKLSLLNEQIENLSKNMNKFGILSHVVLRVAINDWISVYNNLEDNLKEKFASKFENYTNKLDTCLNIEETKKRATTVEKFIMLSWEKLNNDIGKINFNDDEYTLTQAVAAASM